VRERPSSVEFIKWSGLCLAADRVYADFAEAVELALGVGGPRRAADRGGREAGLARRRLAAGAAAADGVWQTRAARDRERRRAELPDPGSALVYPDKLTVRELEQLLALTEKASSGDATE
jgi:hypothetical protein